MFKKNLRCCEHSWMKYEASLDGSNVL